MANWAEQLDAAVSLLCGAVDTVHEALVVDAVTQPELVPDFVTHDVA